MNTLITVVHVLIALVLIALVLLQKGKGAEVGASFGSGASNTVFGSRGTGSFLTHSTAILAGLFFLTSLSLAYFSVHAGGQSVVSEATAPTQSAAQKKPLPAPAPASAPMPAPFGKFVGGQPAEEAPKAPGQ